MNSENRLLDGLKDKFGRSSFGRDDVKAIAKELGLSSPRWFLNDEKYRVSRGLYQIPELNNSQHDFSPHALSVFKNQSNICSS